MDTLPGIETIDTDYKGKKERFKSLVPNDYTEAKSMGGKSARSRVSSVKPMSAKRRLKIAGDTVSRTSKKERFNEDAESVAKSVR